MSTNHDARFSIIICIVENKRLLLRNSIKYICKGGEGMGETGPISQRIFHPRLIVKIIVKYGTEYRVTC